MGNSHIFVYDFTLMRFRMIFVILPQYKIKKRGKLYVQIKNCNKNSYLFMRHILDAKFVYLQLIKSKKN